MKSKEVSLKMADSRIVVGIDQSYQDAGISVVMNGNIKNIEHCKLSQYKTNTERRIALVSRLANTFTYVSSKAKQRGNTDVVCLIERIRLQSDGFINIDYIKSIGALNAVIVDTANRYNIPVYSVDTRAWKSQVVGTSKPQDNKYGIDPNKWPTIQYVKDELKREGDILEQVSARKQKGIVKVTGGIRWTYNDNKADSVCIALYGFIPPNKQKLQEEH